MKVEILDDEIFNALLPVDIAKYLAGNRWHEIKRNDNEVSIWETADKTGKKYRVWLPLDVNLGDFAISIGRLIKSVAIAENRSQLQVVEDLETVGVGDVIRSGTQDLLSRTSHSLLFNEGLSLINKSYGLAVAAAYSTLEKRAVYAFRRPAKVVEYLKNLRLGQSEKGSYLVKLISPLPTTLYSQLPIPFPAVEPVSETPFERQVVINLIKSLDVLHRVTQETYRRGKFYFEVYQEVVSEGVSANLCEAVTGDEENENKHRPINISVSWSYLVNAPTENLPEQVTFPVEYMPYLVKAAQTFREQNPEEISFQGFVTALKRPEFFDPGAVTIAGLLLGKQRNVRMMLGESDYRTAIHAHEKGLPISVDGELIKQGVFYVITKPQNFHIVEKSDDDS